MYTMSMQGSMRENEQGFASIVIAIVLVLVLSLTTIGFAQLMRNEQRSALDKQLSNQAYYAAESGINDASKAINNGFSEAKTECGPLPADDNRSGAAQLKTSSVGNNSGASYTCLLINPFPDELKYLIYKEEPRATQITGANPSNPAETVLINSIVVGWEDESANTSFAPNPDPGYRFDTATAWKHTGLLKITLTPLTSAGINRDKLTKETYTAYLYPNTSSPSNPPTYSYGSGLNKDGGVILNGNCHVNNRTRAGQSYCAVEITGLASGNYLMTMSSVYQNSKVTVLAKGEGGSALKIKNAQTVIDSTGKAQDVLRRVQARISTRNDYVPPAGTEAALSICKQLQLTPDSGSSGSPDVCPAP